MGGSPNNGLPKIDASKSRDATAKLASAAGRAFVFALQPSHMPTHGVTPYYTSLGPKQQKGMTSLHNPKKSLSPSCKVRT